MLLRNARASLANREKGATAGSQEDAVRAEPVAPLQPNLMGRLLGDKDLDTYNQVIGFWNCIQRRMLVTIALRTAMLKACTLPFRTSKQATLRPQSQLQDRTFMR